MNRTFLCALGLHRWTKWSTPDGSIYVRQSKACLACNKYKARRV